MVKWPDAALAVFLAANVWGLWVGGNEATAGDRFVAVAVGVVVYLLISRLPSRMRWRHRHIHLRRAIALVVPCVIAVYFLATNDWSAQVEKTAWLNPIRLWLSERGLTNHLPRLHPNTVGGVLAMWLPLQLVALVRSRRSRTDPSRSNRTTVLRFGALTLSCVALLLTSLRGAWIALAIATAIWVLWRLAGLRGASRSAPLCIWFVGAILTIFVSFNTAWGARLLASRPDRLQVWRNSWGLAHDYWLTGLGLGNFTMAYSSYALLLHVPHTTHAHNLILDIWLAAGLPGVAAFALAILAAFTSARVDAPVRRPPSLWGIDWADGAVVALLVVLTHGLIDDSYYGYGGAGTVWLFVPLAWLVAVGADRSVRAKPLALGAVAACVMVIAASALPRVRAGVHANWGALLQTRRELPAYRWPEWPVQDALRRSPRIDLEPVIFQYRRALAIEPPNGVANRRLGQIELALGAYDDARQHLELAYRAEPWNAAARQLYGESLALTGAVAQSAALWRATTFVENQLAIREKWYETVANDQQRQWFNQAIRNTNEP